MERYPFLDSKASFNETASKKLVCGWCISEAVMGQPRRFARAASVCAESLQEPHSNIGQLQFSGFELRTCATRCGIRSSTKRRCRHVDRTVLIPNLSLLTFHFKPQTTLRHACGKDPSDKIYLTPQAAEYLSGTLVVHVEGRLLTRLRACRF